MTKAQYSFLYFLFLARGFGMRVVGGKIGPDGQMFASIVWTVPGGPAEKSGLQQGDKVKYSLYTLYSPINQYELHFWNYD